MAQHNFFAPNANFPGAFPSQRNPQQSGLNLGGIDLKSILGAGAGALLGNQFGINPLAGAATGFGLSGNSPAQRLALGLGPIGAAFDAQNKIFDKIPSKFDTPFSTVQNGTTRIDPSVRAGQEDILGRLRGNENAFVQARVRPFQRQAEQTRARIEQGLSNRNIGGSLLTNELAKFESQVNPVIGDQAAIATNESLNAQNNILNQRFNQELSSLGLSAEQINLLTGQAQLESDLIGRSLGAVGNILQPAPGGGGGFGGVPGGAPGGAPGGGFLNKIGDAAGGLISKGVGAVGNGISDLFGAGTFTNLAGQLPFSGGFSNPFSNPFIGGPNKIGSFGGGGLASAGAGLGGNILARQVFPNVGSLEGSIGSTIGGIVGSFTPLGPIGAAIGSFIGGAIGGQVAGGDKDNIDASLITSSDRADKGFKKGLFAEGAFGKIGLKRGSTRNMTGKQQKAIQPLLGAIAELDNTLAEQMSPEEITAMKAQNLSAGNVRGNSKKMWTKSINRRESALNSVIPASDPRSQQMLAYLQQMRESINKKGKR